VNTPGLEALRRNLDAAIAVAQHYGLPTGFLDFTLNPAVVGYFASVPSGKPDDKTACIYCLSIGDLTNLWNWVRGVLPHYPEIEPVVVDVFNLWRLEAQESVFLRCPLYWENYYPMDRIEFPLGARPSYPTDDQIYPQRKSPLEELLDQHFQAEKLDDFRRLAEEVFPDADVLEIRAPECGFHQEYFVNGRLSQLRSWAKCRIQQWLVVSEEKFYSTIGGEISLKLSPGLAAEKVREHVAYGVRHSLESNPLLRNQAVRWEIPLRGRTPKALSHALDRLWNGLRRLPYSVQDIADGIGLCVALYCADFHKKEGPNEQVAVAERFLGSCLGVEIASWNGSHAHAIVCREQLAAALRPDLRQRLRPEYRHYENNIEALLALCCCPRHLFAFESFSRLFATQMAPTQVLISAHNPGHFSPARTSAFGLP
jgi:hypothetical protein